MDFSTELLIVSKNQKYAHTQHKKDVIRCEYQVSM